MSPRVLTDQPHSYWSDTDPLKRVQALTGLHVHYGRRRRIGLCREAGTTIPTRAQLRFESAGRHRGGHSGGATPVPIPNTEVKPASVSASTGVREPLGIPTRRLSTHTIRTHRERPPRISLSTYARRAPTPAVVALTFQRRLAGLKRPCDGVRPLGLSGGRQYVRVRQGGRVRPNAAACRAAHRRFKSGPWLNLRSSESDG